MSHPVGKWTTLLMNAMDEGSMTPEAVANMCLEYMSEADVADMCSSNDIEDFLDPSAEDEDKDEDE